MTGTGRVGGYRAGSYRASCYGGWGPPGGDESVPSPEYDELPHGGPDTPASLVIADDLPDGLVIADEAGRVEVFNAAAARLTGRPAADALGKHVYDVLALRDSDDRSWWACTDPYHGLCTRTRHPEASLYLPDGTEVLVTMGYVRDRRREPGRPGACAAS